MFLHYFFVALTTVNDVRIKYLPNEIFYRKIRSYVPIGSSLHWIKVKKLFIEKINKHTTSYSLRSEFKIVQYFKIKTSNELYNILNISHYLN